MFGMFFVWDVFFGCLGCFLVGMLHVVGILSWDVGLDLSLGRQEKKKD